MRAIVAALAVVGFSGVAIAQPSRVPVGGESPASATKPLPGTMEEAAAAHVLTLDEVRRLIALMHEVAALNSKNPGSLDLPEAFSPTLDETVAGLSIRPALRAVVTRHGFTPRSYLIAMNAYNATIATVKSPELVANTEFAGTPANLAFYRANAAELDSLLDGLMSELAARKTTRKAAQATNRGDPAANRAARAAEESTFYRNKARLADSVSHHIRTDSLRRLLTAITAADDAELESLGQAIRCEQLRLGYQNGFNSADLAMARMRDSLRAEQPERYQRNEARIKNAVDGAVSRLDVCRIEELPQMPYQNP